MIVLIDNYDSFSYNLYQLLGKFGQSIKVIRNDEMTVCQIREMNPDYLVLSPGPGRPKEAGVCIDAVKSFGGEIPILGVCLGHQAICEAFGGTISYAKERMHGKASKLILETETILFQGLEDPISVARYHSLAALEETIPEELRVTARTQDGEVMAVEHQDHAVYGVQFHPESILTPQGEKIIENFLMNGKGENR